jgi:hypothetical protein
MNPWLQLGEAVAIAVGICALALLALRGLAAIWDDYRAGRSVRTARDVHSATRPLYRPVAYGPTCDPRPSSDEIATTRAARAYTRESGPVMRAHRGDTEPTLVHGRVA